MRRFWITCAVRVSLSSLLILLLAGQVLAQGVELREGAPAPFSGILIRAEDLAAAMLKKDAEIEKLKVHLEHAQEVAAIKEGYCKTAVETLQGEIKALGEKNLALERQMQILAGRVDHWRFGLGLIFVKSPW